MSTSATVKEDVQGDFIAAAARGDDATVALALLDSRVNLNQARNGVTALAAAANCRHLSVIDVLLNDPRVHPNARGRGRRTPLLSVLEQSKYAVRYRATLKGGLGDLGTSYLAVVQRLLEDGRVDPNAEDDHGRGALDVACQPFMCADMPYEVPPSVPLLRLLLANKRTQPSQHQWRAAPFYDAALAYVLRCGRGGGIGGGIGGNEATPVEFIVAVATGDVPEVASGLRNAAHVDPNMNAGFHGGMLWYRTLPPTSSALAVAVVDREPVLARAVHVDVHLGSARARGRTARSKRARNRDRG